MKTKYVGSHPKTMSGVAICWVLRGDASIPTQVENIDRPHLQLQIPLSLHQLVQMLEPASLCQAANFSLARDAKTIDLSAAPMNGPEVTRIINDSNDWSLLKSRQPDVQDPSSSPPVHSHHCHSILIVHVSYDNAVCLLGGAAVEPTMSSHFQPSLST